MCVFVWSGVVCLDYITVDSCYENFKTYLDEFCFLFGAHGFHGHFIRANLNPRQQCFSLRFMAQEFKRKKLELLSLLFHQVSPLPCPYALIPK